MNMGETRDPHCAACGATGCVHVTAVGIIIGVAAVIVLVRWATA